jgi:hypothetical protein
MGGDGGTARRETPHPCAHTHTHARLKGITHISQPCGGRLVVQPLQVVLAQQVGRLCERPVEQLVRGQHQAAAERFQQAQPRAVERVLRGDEGLHCVRDGAQSERIESAGIFRKARKPGG